MSITSVTHAKTIAYDVLIVTVPAALEDRWASVARLAGYQAVKEMGNGVIEITVQRTDPVIPVDAAEVRTALTRLYGSANADGLADEKRKAATQRK